MPTPTPRERFMRGKTLYKSARYTLVLQELERRFDKSEKSAYDGPATILKARTALYGLSVTDLAVSTLNDYL